MRTSTSSSRRHFDALADDRSHDHTVLTGRPEMKAMRMLGAAHGYRLDGISDRAGLLRDDPYVSSVGAYRQGRRKTVRLVRDDDTRSPAEQSDLLRAA